MPKKIDPAVKERAVKLVLEHQAEYPSLFAAITAVAKQQRLAGVPRREATLAACRLRLRPIIMTSFAFILGVVPLIVSHGAGAEMRQALGVAVFSGMLGVTLFGLILTPVFFFTIDWLGTSQIFAAPLLRRVSDFVLAGLSLRPARQLGRLAWQTAMAARARLPKRGKADKPAETFPLAPEETIIVQETVQMPGIVHETHGRRIALREKLVRRSK